MVRGGDERRETVFFRGTIGLYDIVCRWPSNIGWCAGIMVGPLFPVLHLAWRIATRHVAVLRTRNRIIFAPRESYGILTSDFPASLVPFSNLARTPRVCSSFVFIVFILLAHASITRAILYRPASRSQFAR